MYNDFRKYSIDKQRLSGTFIDDISKHMGTQASMTPYIIEKSELHGQTIDIFSRMLVDRILWLSGPINDQISVIMAAQLIYLDTISEADISMYCDTPGGSCKSGLTIKDSMDYVACDVSTTNIGMCASMGSIILGNGAKNKRHSLPNARVMIHMVSSQTSGTLKDMKIDMAESEKVNDILFGYLGEFCNKTPEQIKIDADRDYWMTAKEAVDYGIVDSIIKSKKKNK